MAATNSNRTAISIQLVAGLFGAAVLGLCQCSIAQDALTPLRRGLLYEVSDRSTNAYHVTMHTGSDTWRMSADGETIAYWFEPDDYSFEAYRIVNVETGVTRTIDEGPRAPDYDSLLTEMFDLSDDGKTLAYVLAHGTGTGNAKQIVVYDVDTDQRFLLPTQVLVQAEPGEPAELADLRIQFGSAHFCLSGDGTRVFFLNRFGPYWGTDDFDASGFTVYTIPTDGSEPATPVLSQRQMKLIPGIHEHAEELYAANCWSDTDYTGSKLTIPVGRLSIVGANPLHILLASLGKGGSSVEIMLNSNEKGLSGGSLSSDGSMTAYSRYYFEDAANNGVFVAPVDGSAPSVTVDPGVPQYGHYGQRPRISGDGSAVVYFHPHSTGGVFWGKSDGSLTRNVSYYISDYPDNELYISYDGSSVCYYGILTDRVRDPRYAEVLHFVWKDATDTSVAPYVPGATMEPFAELLRTPGVSPTIPYTIRFTPVGSDLGCAVNFPMDNYGRIPDGANGFADYFFDSKQADGIFEDEFIWAHTSLVLDSIEVRTGITATQGIATFMDASVPVRDPVTTAANFEADVTEGRAPLTVMFTDISTGDIVSRDWDINAQSPAEYKDAEVFVTHTYDVPGFYSVKLTVEGFGGTDSTTKEDYIHVLEPLHEQDIDGDGSVNAVDVQLCINGVLGLDTQGLNPDVDEDGDLDAVDVQLTINAALGLI